ncbi:MAG: hypothetical protein HY434_02575 [Candidatus Liptonbacteria bacterium]|nr:hypothetical protein [Candidatus Liptonbacteria bacterium]
MPNFLEKLQSSDESTKRRWMFVSTLVVMVAVVYVWFAYFNNLVGNVNTPEPREAPGGGFTFWQSMQNGVAILYETVAGKVRALGEILKAPREYIVSPPR